MAQIRLDNDLEDRLRELLESEGGSLAQLANRLIRARLDDLEEPPPAPAPRQASIQRARARIPSRTGQLRR